ncbi:MAG TPA: DUF3256 family protein [Bacteroidales bacterium]|nr:DUF3256 family protein [Bacteroidales bacterium]
MKIRRIFLFIAIVFTLNFTAGAQNIINYFIDMPIYLLPSFDKILKQELVENYQKNPERDSINNLLGGKTRLLSLDTIANNLKIQSTSASKVEIQLINRPDSSRIIGIINTVCAPICSSYIKFYDTEWNEIKVNFPKITIDNWLNPSNSEEQNKLVKNAVRIDFLEYNFSSDGKKVVVHNRSEKHLDIENRKEIVSLVDFEKIVEIELLELIK